MCYFQRASLIEALSKVQPQPELISQLTSIASIQTKGLRKHFLEQEKGELHTKRKQRECETEDEPQILNSISGSKRKRLQLIGAGIVKNGIEKDPNVVGFEVMHFQLNLYILEM